MRFVQRIAAVVSWLAALVMVGFLVVPYLAQMEGATDAQREETADQDNDGEARPAIAVTYVETVPQDVEDVERVLATVEAKWSARIAAEVAGTLDSIEVDAGDHVEPGMVLARIDARDFEIEVERASANVRRLESRVANSERNVARQQQLSKSGHVSDAALEEAETELAALRQELAAARSEVDRAERNLQRTKILAPHGGTVAERLVSDGDYVSAGTVILEIPRADRLQVRIPVPEAAAERLSVGMPVRLKTVGADEPVEAQVTHIHPDVTSTNRTITVIAEIDNPGNWRPGSTVDAEIVIETRQAIALAPTSVVRRSAGNVVYVLDGEVAREHSVTLGQRTREAVEITSGLAAGEQVVVDGAGFLSDGTRVNPRPHDGGRSEPTSLTAMDEPER